MFISENEINSLINGRDEVWDVLNYAIAKHDLKYDGDMVLELSCFYCCFLHLQLFPILFVDLFCILVLELSFHLVFDFCW